MTGAASSSTRPGAAPVLVPVDFSADSEAALTWAVDVARCLAAPVLVLHVVHDPSAAPGYYQGIRGKKTAARIEDQARAMFDDWLRRMKDAHPEVAAAESTSEMVVGLPATRILEVAERVGARMIVMGSKGRTGLSHLLIGSKAERIVRLSPIPVTIVKARAPAPDAY